MIFYGTKEAINKYFESPNLSQSEAKALAEGLDEYKKYKNKEKDPLLFYEEDKEHFIIGSAVDTILTGGEDRFAEEYYISEVTNKPSDTLISINMFVLDKVEQDYEEFITNESESRNITLFEYWRDIVSEDVKNEYVIQGCEAHEYQSRWGDAAKIKAVNINQSLYFQSLLESQGKQILSKEDAEKIFAIVESLRNFPEVKYYLIDEYKYSSSCHILFQVPIYFSYNDVSCKALLDMVIVDMNTHRFTLFDFKTMYGKTSNFYQQSYLKRGYDIQAAWYITAVKTRGLKNSFIDLKSSIDLEDEDNIQFATEYERLLRSVNNFTISDYFIFIVESTTHIGNPKKYKVSKDVLELAMSGHKTLFSDSISYDGNKIIRHVHRKARLGVDSLIELYKWYQNTLFTKDFHDYNRNVLDIYDTGVDDPLNNLIKS